MNKAELNGHQRKAAAMLASGIRQNDIARTLGVAKQTVSQWRSQPAFVQEYETLLGEEVDALRAGVRSLQAQALGVIREVMTDPTAPAAARVRAALAILDRIEQQDPRLRPMPVAPPAQQAGDDVWAAIQQARASKVASETKQLTA